MKQNLWLTMVTCLAYCLDKELWRAIEYLKEQVRVLKEQQEKDKRILLDNRQRTRLAAKAKRLTRELLEETTILFTPDTILGWYRKLIAQKYDGSANRKTTWKEFLRSHWNVLVACDFFSIERLVRSIKEGCLSQLILSSEAQLRYVLSEYLQYYHHERIHQGINRIIEPQHGGNQGDIICIERPGGLLKSYHRKAA